MAQFSADPEALANLLDLPEGLSITDASFEVGEYGNSQVVLTLEGRFYEKDGTEVVFSVDDGKAVTALYHQNGHGAVSLMGLEET